jgi:hypothetical protein
VACRVSQQMCLIVLPLSAAIIEYFCTCHILRVDILHDVPFLALISASRGPFVQPRDALALSCLVCHTAPRAPKRAVMSEGSGDCFFSSEGSEKA